MEELIKFASLIPTVLFFALGVGILILMADALFIFAVFCTRLTQRVISSGNMTRDVEVRYTQGGKKNKPASDDDLPF